MKLTMIYDGAASTEGPEVLLQHRLLKREWHKNNNGNTDQGAYSARAVKNATLWMFCLVTKKLGPLPRM